MGRMGWAYPLCPILLSPISSAIEVAVRGRASVSQAALVARARARCGGSTAGQGLAEFVRPGRQIGEIARTPFPGGTRLAPDKRSARRKATRQALASVRLWCSTLRSADSTSPQPKPRPIRHLQLTIDAATQVQFQ